MTSIFSNVTYTAFSVDIPEKFLVLEFRSIDRIEVLVTLGVRISDAEKTRIMQTLVPEKTTSLFFYPDHPHIEQIQCVFFGKDTLLHEERAQILRPLVWSSFAYCPHFDEIEAFEAMILSCYLFDQYKTKKTHVQRMFLYTEPVSEFGIIQKMPLLESIITARNLVNTPSYDLYPATFVDRFRQRKWKHFDVHVFWESELKEMGCNLILAVGAGTEKESYMVVLTPKKSPKTEKYALVGKWVTFDSWGVQIKPDKGMEDMKCDMAGGATVFAVASYLDSLDELPLDITFAVGLVENMTGGWAYKPLDVYTAYNGTSVEIVHTDAEWRLVLADVMSYVEKQYGIQHMISIATLTGACIYALWYDMAGIMGDDDFVIESIAHMQIPFESVWRLPLTARMKKSLESSIADIKNLSEEKAGSSQGWAFLSYFQWDAKLTHIDIAGPSYRMKPYGYMPQWGTGWGVALLANFFTSFWR